MFFARMEFGNALQGNIKNALPGLSLSLLPVKFAIAVLATSYGQENG